MDFLVQQSNSMRNVEINNNNNNSYFEPIYVNLNVHSDSFINNDDDDESSLYAEINDTQSLASIRSYEKLNSTSSKEESTTTTTTTTNNNNINNNLECDSNLVDSLIRLKTVRWYWGPLSAFDAERVLKHRPNGSFLLRDSTHDSYFLTITVKTNNSLFHIRLEHVLNGKRCFLNSFFSHKIL